MANIYIFLSTLIFSVLIATKIDAQISKRVDCEENPLDVIFLIDVSARNVTDFKGQQTKIADIIRHIQRISTGRSILYSVVAFHQRPVIVLSIATPFASNPEKVLKSVTSLNPRGKFNSSPAKALELAAQQNSLENIKAKVFAITSTKKPNLPALTGYTMDRTRVYASETDRAVFFEEIDRAIGACTLLIESNIDSTSTSNDIKRGSALALGVRTREVGDAGERVKSSFEGECRANKIDLVVVLDTSGSVFNAFAEERKLAHELIESFSPATFEDGRLQVSVIRFSSSAAIKVPFKIGQSRAEILEKLDEIKFTGADTGIARAVDLALAELSRSRRNDAIQVFILITDGYGQEFWHVAQMAGKKLQSANAEVFAVSTSRDYNLAELTLYTGDSDRVYVGAHHQQFISTIVPLINKCLRANLSQVPEINSSSSSSEQKLLEIDSTASMKTTEAPEPTTSETIETIIEEISKPISEPESSTHTAESAGADHSTVGTASETSATDTTVTSNIISSTVSSDHLVTATSKKPATEVPAANEADADLEALADSFEELDSSAQLRNSRKGRLFLKAKGSLSQTNSSRKLKLNENLKSKLAVNKAVEEKHTEGNSSAQVISPLRRTSAGRLDLLFAIDRSPNSPADLLNQLKLATDLVDELTEEDFDDERIRVAVISFANDARIDLEWGKATNKSQVLQRLAAIEYTANDTSAVAGVQLATQYARIARRPNSRLMIILISDGSSQDVWHTITQTAKKLHELTDTIIYAVTTSKQYKFIELEAFTGDKWRVYVDGRTRRFIADAGKHLTLSEAADTEKLDTSSVPPQHIESTSHSDDNLDLIILVDTSTVADNDFEAAKNLLEVLLRSVPAVNYNTRLRVALLAFANKVRVENELKKPTTKDDILYAVERLQNNAADTSVPTAINTALSQLNSAHRRAQRLVFIILTDGGSRDSVNVMNDAATKLRRKDAEVYVLPITSNYSRDELLLYTGDQSRLITNSKGHEQDFANYVNLNGGRAIRKDFVKRKEENELLVEKKFTLTTLNDEKAFATSKPDLAVEAAAENELNSALSDFDLPFALSSTSKVEEPSDENCLVDLMFIVDKSQSVENIFQKQLQIAVSLVQRIPPSLFEERVRVAAVSFSSRAQIDFRFDEFNNQTEILHALLSIVHTGGSTSAVSGVNLAVGEIRKTGRKDARKMIVLISDGNSQDRWEELLDAEARLRATKAIVYAISASHDYYFRELELYAGSKWLVYVDARRRQFLDDAEMSILKCQSPSAPVSSRPENEKTVSTSSVLPGGSVMKGGSDRSAFLTTPASVSECRDAMVDLLFIIDTSTSVENDFYKEKTFALNLIKVIPLEDFLGRIAVAVVQFSDNAKIQFGFGKERIRGDILYELERMERTGGQTSLVAAADAALLEIASNRRSSARLVIVIVSDGNSQDMWSLVQKAARKLQKTGAEIYAVTFSKEYNFAELEEYAGSPSRVYVGNKVDSFIEDVGASILNCNKTRNYKNVAVTYAPSEEIQITPPSESILSAARANVGKQINDVGKKGLETVAAKLLSSNDLARDEKPVIPARTPKLHSNSCSYRKVDLEIILDASTSRQEVFEHQRELALSLIERLPIDAGETHVAIGINSFTSVPILRQTLGLGRDKQMVRHAIEDIKYNGGSTFTAQAVELSVQDLERGRRPDAIQIVVLMNDGMSQDPWEKVLEASQLLRNTGAELFGVALGDKIDSRELKHYIGNKDRIYRDNSTEKFLSDVVSLLTGGEKCGIPTSVNLNGSQAAPQIPSSTEDICNSPNLDIMILFDNADETANQSDPNVASNRYLLLDVLGSLPVTEDDRVKISVITFNSSPELVIGLDDEQDKDTVFNKVESIEAKPGQPSYAKAVSFAVQKYNEGHRTNARGIMVIVGNGESHDKPNERTDAIQRLRSLKNLNIYAVDSGKWMDVLKLTEYTGKADNIFNYDRNAEFAKLILNAAQAADKAQCPQISQHAGLFAAVNSATIRSQQNGDRKKDVPNKVDIDLKQFEDDKIVVREKSIITEKPRRLRLHTTTRIPKSTTVTEEESSSSTESTVTTKTVLESNKANDVFIVENARKRTKGKDIEKTKDNTIKHGLSTPQETSKRFSFSNTPETVINTTTPATTASTTSFIPGCEIDVIIIIDSSGSVEETFSREKELAIGVINRLRLGPDNARVAVIKFAAKEKVKTVWSFTQPQEQQQVINAIQEIPFSSGTTAIHTALRQAITEYSSTKGARPGQATPFGIIFTDGFGQKDSTEAATLLRNLIPNMYAVAINHQYPISTVELERIAGSKDRVFTDQNVDKLYEVLSKITRTC